MGSLRLLLLVASLISVALAAPAALSEKTAMELLGFYEEAPTSKSTSPLALVQSMAQFDGCYSDADVGILGSGVQYHQEIRYNHNNLCAKICKEKGFAIVSTRDADCYCTNTLPLPRLYDAYSKLAAGDGGPCTTTCPGVFTTVPCEGDECCGGQNAYSVFIVGEIEVLKQMERRVVENALNAERAARMLRSRGQDALKYACGTAFYQPEGTSSYTDQEWCLYDYQEAAMRSDTYYTSSNSKHWAKKELMRDCLIEWVYVAFRGHGDGRQENLYAPNVVFKDARGDVTWNSATAGINVMQEDEDSLYGESYGFKMDLKSGDVAGYIAKSFEIQMWENGYDRPRLVSLYLKGLCPPAKVSVVASGQTTNKDGFGPIKTLNLTRLPDGSEILEEIVRPESLEMLEMEVVVLEKLLESEEPIMEEPFSTWDLLCDNFFGGSGLSCSKDYSESTGFRETFSTQAGLSVAVTIGAEFQVGAIFAKATTTFELTVGFSFSFGWSKTTTMSRTEGFSYSVTADPGTKVEVRFFKSDIPVQVKWRATMFADGYVLVRFGEYPEEYKFHLSEVLTYNQRLLNAFGTIDYGMRPTIIGRTKTVDREGNIVFQTEDDRELVPDLEDPPE